MFDLNKTPTLVEEEGNSQDSGTEKKLQMQVNSATPASPKTITSSSTNYTFDSSDLAPLLMMVQGLPNDHPSTTDLGSNSNHTRLPPTHTSAFSEAPATVRRSGSSPVLKHLAMVAPASGEDAPAVHDVTVSPLLKHDRVVEVLSRKGASGGLCGNQSQAMQCQTTVDMDCHVVSDGESDCFMPRNSRDNSNSKTVLVALDTLPDESPVELQFPWSPVHQGEAPLHTPTFQGSSENLPVSATKLTLKELQEQLRLREVAFNATFKFQTQRCTPTARCTRCLAFCQARLPLRFPSSQGGGGTGGGLQLSEESPPVLRNVADDEAKQARKLARHGPKSKSSEYRGVTFYKRTGRWEAHIWHEGAQVYLGASGTKEEAARAYDQAALLLCGPDVDINFKPESYKLEMAYLYKLSKEQLVLYLRRDSRGFGAQVSYHGVKHVKNLNHYEAMYGRHVLGTFAIEEDAARAVYKEAVRNSSEALASLILDAHHVRNMPSYAAQRFAALYPEAVEGMQLTNQAKASISKRPSVPQRPSNSTSSPQKKKRSTRQATKPNQDSTSPPATARAIAAPGVAEQLPGVKINENIEVSPEALSPTRSWGASLAPRKRHRHAARINLMAAQPNKPLQSHPHQPSNGANTPLPQQLRSMLPKFVRAPAATTASSSCHAPSAPSIPRATGEASSSGVIKFKLFNVEISVAAEPGHGGDRTESHGESEAKLCNQLISPPRKRCKTMEAASPATPTPKPKKLCKKCKKCLLAQGRRF